MNGKQLAVLLALVGAAAVLLGQHQSTPVSEFDAWKSHHGISFASQFENAYRERVFLENLAKINLHNANEHKTYEMGLNQFSALTQEEFAETYLTLIAPEEYKNVESNEEYTIVGDVDWESQGYVTPVKNQGQCGSCWAFSTTGGLEWLSKKAEGSLFNFSEQQLVDCSSSYGNQACNGGLMTNSFKYVKDKGITTQDDYPYKGVKGTCVKEGGWKINGFVEVKSCSELSNAIVERAVSVAVDASNWSPYKSGVFNNCRTSLNHGVTLVGVSAGNWWIKNSWGPSWGEKGHIRLAAGNTCGVCNMASYPTK